MSDAVLQEEVILPVDKKEENNKSILVYNHLKSFYIENKKFPVAAEASKVLGLTYEDYKEQIGILIVKGLLRRKHSQYRIPGIMKRRRKINNSIILRKEIEEKERIKEIKHIKQENTVSDKILKVLKIIASVIGVMTLAAEIYFNFVFTSHNYENFFVAIGMSMIFVLSGSISFEFFWLFRTQRKFDDIKRKFVIEHQGLMILFLGLWIICESVIISTSMGGQYNKIQTTIQNETKRNISEDNNTLIYADYNDSIKDKQKDLDSKRKERDKMQEILARTTDQDKDYQNITWRITVKDKEIKTLSNDIDSLKEKKNMLLKSNTNSNIVDKKDYYAWLAQIFKTDYYFIEFLQNCMYAVFLGIISCLFFAFVLFYKNK